ncbi:MAG: hypothetical protein KatS3mg105_5177 [Gemmatales bacterium]|nr:MAG: hypothetical protein KatS3mg105_5177 [Gemmatales bacterium]
MNERRQRGDVQAGHDRDPQLAPSHFGSLFDRYADDRLASREIPHMEEDKIINSPEGSITGDLDRVLNHWDGPQSYPDTCAIRCQEYILECFTGQELDERTFVQEAYDRGWYTPGGGTPLLHVGDLLELHGIEVTRYVNSNIFHLANELAQGHKVIVGLDSNELWCGDSDGAWLFQQVQDYFGFAGADHAVIVTGIDTTDPGNPQVIVTDPGTGEPFARYPYEQFVEAWRDSNFFMVATVEPTPASLPEMANFDIFRDMLLHNAGSLVLGYLWDLWNEFEPEVEFPYANPITDAGPLSLATGVGDTEHDDHDFGLESSDLGTLNDCQEPHEFLEGHDHDADDSDGLEFD